MTETQNLSDYAIINPDNKYLNPKNIFIFLGIAVFLKMLVLNFLIPTASDDFYYATSSSILDALQHEYEHYLTWGGRSVVHFLVRVFLMMPKYIFNIANALVFTAFTLIIYIIANPQNTICCVKPPPDTQDIV